MLCGSITFILLLVALHFSLLFSQMIQKLSTRTPELEVRMKLLKEIASENNIVLQLHQENEEHGTLPTVPNKTSETSENSSHVSDIDGFSGSSRAGRKYRDVADAAQAAFESAAYAAEAALAAVELSRSDSDNPAGTPKDSPRKLSVVTDNKRLSTLKQEEPKATTKEWKGKNVIVDENSSCESGENIEDEEIVKKLEKDIVFDEGSDDDDDDDEGGTGVIKAGGGREVSWGSRVGEGHRIASVRTTRVSSGY